MSEQDVISSLKQDKNYQNWSLPIRLEKIANSLLLDGKPWMAETIHEAAKKMAAHKLSITSLNEKIHRQKQALNDYKAHFGKMSKEIREELRNGRT